MKKRIKFLVKFLFGIIILVYLFTKTSVQEFIHLLANANYKYYFWGVILYIIGQIISAKKWMILSQRLKFNYSFQRYLNLYFLGMFYNMFLPTNIGGDVIKVAKMRDEQPENIKRGVISVLSDRITGVLVLFVFVSAGFMYYKDIQIINAIGIFIICSTILGILGFTCVMKNENIIPEKYKNIHNLISLICEKKCVMKIIILSLIFHILLIIIHAFIAKMYNLNIPIMYYLLLYPITAIVASLPVSINGIGLKELVYVYMLKSFNIDNSTAILFAMTLNMIILFASLFGFIPYFSKNLKNQMNN